VTRCILCVVLGMALGVGLAAAPRTTWDGVFTKEQALDGAVVYQESCSTCHGPNLEGGEDAPPLAGAQFSTVWEGRGLGDLLNRLERRMPMDAPGSLTRAAYTNLVAFLLEQNGFPPGPAPLSADPATLNTIRYLAVAP
jgi:mono/diheme cytochrome c family protein